MIENLENYLKNSIDSHVKITSMDAHKGLPAFLMENYRFFQMKLLNEPCVLMEILNDQLSITSLTKHIQIVGKTVGVQIVLYYRRISNFRRKGLIENRIAFVLDDGQLYLPFLAMDLKKLADKSMAKSQKFSSSAHLVFLYFLYHKDAAVNATELAELLDISTMSASRGLNELYDAQLLTCEIGGKTGRSKRYTRLDDPQFFQTGRDYLASPILKVIYVETIKGTLIAGLEALSAVSMLNPPQQLVRAISKEKLGQLKPNAISDLARISEGNLTELQIWKYDPDLFSTGGIVDMASLWLSLYEIKDERVALALEERLKQEKWFMA